jgi:nucleoside-diphosphate-sugar epimerase
METVRPEIVMQQLTDLPKRPEESRSEAARARNARIREEGTRNLVEAALRCSVRRMIAQSIGFVYAPGREPHSENDPLAPERTSVMTLERLVTQSPPLEGIVLRYGLFYGPGTWYEGPQGPFTVHVDAAAQAALLAIARAAPGIYNVGEPSGYASSAKAQERLGWSPEFRIEERVIRRALRR